MPKRLFPVAIVALATLVLWFATSATGAASATTHRLADTAASGTAAPDTAAPDTAAPDTTAPDTERVDSLTTPKAVLLGVVEGVTEFLPISSTGHLLVTQQIIGVGQGADEEAADTYVVVIQLGAILAVLGIYRHRFALMLEGVVGRSPEGLSLIRSLLLAFFPAVVIALAFQDPIKERLLAPWPVVAAWVVGGVAILFVSSWRERLTVRHDDIGALPVRVALGIGLVQSLALWPGTSRSLVTILAALALGCSLRVAVEFSFLLGFVTLSAASAYELLERGSTLYDAFGWVNPLVGMVAAGISAFVSVRWMVSYLERHPLTIFGWYRIGAGAVTAVLLLTGVI